MAQPNEVTTRVNKAMVGTYVGRTVRAIGRVLSYKGDVLELQLADGGVVFVHDLGNRHEVGSIIEVIAKVTIQSSQYTSYFNSLGSRSREFRRI